MPRIIAQVWFDDDEENRNGRPVFSVIEMEFATFSEFQDKVQEDAAIRGNVLWTRRGVTHEHTIESRQPIVFRGSAVQRSVPSRWTFKEKDEAHV